VVGSALIWVPAVIGLAVAGHWGRSIVLTAICAGVAGTVDNFLRPILLSGRARLSGLLVFISVLGGVGVFGMRSEEHTSELQSRGHLVCRLLLEKKKEREVDLYV